MAGLLVACASQLKNVPLEWKPTADINSAVFKVPASKIRFETFKDTRSQPALIAENREDDTPKPVTTKDDVGTFVSTQMRQVFNRLGYNIVDAGGDAVVSGDVTDFLVEETNRYRGNVVVHLTVRNPAGAVLWDGNASGSASTFGRSYSLENYYEVLSDSLVNATTALLQDHEFQRALAKDPGLLSTSR
jgi:hypothetical protein